MSDSQARRKDYQNESNYEERFIECPIERMHPLRTVGT